VLVTGIQSAQVLGLRRPFRAADATLLDPCDEHRDEGVERVQGAERGVRAARGMRVDSGEP
jgi:hypothetical protein